MWLDSLTRNGRFLDTRPERSERCKCREHHTKGSRLEQKSRMCRCLHRRKCHRSNRRSPPKEDQTKEGQTKEGQTGTPKVNQVGFNESFIGLFSCGVTPKWARKSLGVPVLPSGCPCSACPLLFCPREQRTKIDWAQEVASLLDGRYANCERVTLVCDNLNTHTIGAFYEAFEPERARQYVRHIDFVFTPKHGSWLNIAENELSSMTRQCITGQRIGELETLHEEIGAWSEDVPQTQRGVDWQMKIDDTRSKLKSAYPKIQL